MKQIRRAVAPVVMTGAVLIATVSVSPQGPTPPAGPQATPAAQQPAAPQGPQPPAGRGGRGGLGGPQENDPANATADYGQKPPIKMLTPEEEARRIWLPPGFKLEPVLTDPDIEESAQIAFDGNGRMFVLELRGYMQDADAGGELDPIGRISRARRHGQRRRLREAHASSSTSWCSRASSCRFGANAVLTMESNADEVWKYTDTNNDGVADKKELVRHRVRPARQRRAPAARPDLGAWTTGSTARSTRSARAGRRTAVGPKEPTGCNGAQWGVAQDNDGKMWFQGGASGMPGYFQFPVHYGNFSVPDQFEDEPEHHVGRAGAHRRHAGRPAVVRMPDGSLQPLHRRRRQRCLPRPSPAEGHRSATTSTARPSPASSAACGRRRPTA